VLLEGDAETIEGEEPSETRLVKIVDYRPNRVAVAVDDGPAGWLVLGDVWYPGWKCKIDGVEVPVRRADFLFRAVVLAAGRHEVVFTFAPDSYRLGRLISLTTLGLLTAGLAAISFNRRLTTRGG
jgi:uncharacterized membrane protein YfhO